jgi:hypothetical protein
MARLALLLASVGVLLAPASAWGGVTVSKKIGFSASATVRETVRKECDLQSAIPAAVADSSSDVSLVDGKGSLSLVITDVHAPGGGVASGPKWVEVKGSYGGKSFRAKRLSGFDPFAGGTCGILHKIARAIGKDIALWLKDPKAGAELGDAR